MPAKAGLSGSLVPDLLRLGRICSPEACGLPGESAVRDFIVLCELREDSLPTLKKKKDLSYGKKMQTVRMMMLFTECSLRVSSGLGASEVFIIGKIDNASSR